jgi:creatinine amidohydrolase
MTWLDVRRALDGGCDRAVVPFGAVEQHESHLPLETDALLGDCLGLLLAERLDALCAPTVSIGCSEHHMGRAGTLSLRPETLRLIVRDVVDSLARHGFRTIVLLPTHAGNAAPLADAARVLEPPSGVRLVAVTDMESLARALYTAHKPSGLALRDAIAHAGEIETSLVAAVAPAAVLVTSQLVNDRSLDGAPRPARQSAVASGDVDRIREEGRSYVAAFLAECVKQIEMQGVR